MREFEKGVVFFQWPSPDLPVFNALMRRVFLPDEVAPTHCSFGNCGAPLDRCMPKARSVDIVVNASYLNTLVECTLLCRPLAIQRVSSDQQNHPDADWPFGAVETCTFRMSSSPPTYNVHNVFAIVDHMPRLTTLMVLNRRIRT